jgi:hypothetical protein
MMMLGFCCCAPAGPAVKDKTKHIDNTAIAMVFVGFIFVPSFALERPLFFQIPLFL